MAEESLEPRERYAEESAPFADGGAIARALCLSHLVFQGIRSSPFQLVLTVVTMSVGTAAMALTFFVGRGGIERVWADVEEMMGQWVIAYSDAGIDRRLLGGRSRPDFTGDDLRAIRERVEGTRLISPIYMSAHLVQARDRAAVLPVDGIGAELGLETMFRPVRGKGISAAGFAGVALECMVTETAAREFSLDPGLEPVLRVGDHPFRVVGVVPDPPRIDQRFLARVVVPYQAARLFWLPAGSIGHVLVAWRSVKDMNQVVRRLREELDAVRGPATYYLSSSQFSIEKSKALVSNLMTVGAVQALFCIVIASIGVLNVMLTSVTRRAREFAVRIAMGASRQVILVLVVIESVLIGLLGAATGVIVALVTAPHVTGVLAARIPQAGLLVPVYCTEGFVLPVLICGLSSLIAGVLPALRARKVDVLAALRAEP